VHISKVFEKVPIQQQCLLKVNPEAHFYSDHVFRFFHPRMSRGAMRGNMRRICSAGPGCRGAPSARSEAVAQGYFSI
jgi:hypothetical protein